MKKKIIAVLKLFFLFFIFIFIFTVIYLSYFLITTFLYPVKLILGQIRLRNKKTVFYVAYNQEPLFGPEIYITKYQPCYSHIDCWYSGTFNECFNFYKETKEREKRHKKLKEKNCVPNEFFYDKEFNDYDDNNNKEFNDYDDNNNFYYLQY